MTSTKIQTVFFFLFLAFFCIWVTLLYSGFLSSTLVNPVRLPSTLTATLFMVSGGIAAVSCAVIGIDYLGIHFGSDHEDSVQTPTNQSLDLQDSRSNTADIEKPQEPFTITETEEIKQDVFSCTIKKQTTVLKYEASKITVGNISVEIDRRKKMHYRDVVSGKYIKPIKGYPHT